MKMTSDIKSLIEHFRKNPDSVFTRTFLAEQLSMDYENLASSLDEVVDGESIFRLGNDRFMFSNNRLLVAFEIFRTVAPNITIEEYEKYKDEEHILMRMSRDREVGANFTQQPDAESTRKRGNQFSI